MKAEDFVFEPGSPLWVINRELALLLAGPKAVLLQIAHPEVACGVAAHSDFKRDSWGRLLRTLDAVYGIAFGTREEASGVAERVRDIHSKVRGSSPRPYSAFSPDAQMWVLATLIAPGLEMYRRFVGPIPGEWLPVYYRQMRHFGSFFGLREDYGPQTWEDFSRYYEEMIRGDLLGSDPLSAELARFVVRPGSPLFLKLGLSCSRYLWEEFLESPVRERLGFRSRPLGRLAAKATGLLLPGLLRLLPGYLRFAPKYRRACNALRE